MNILNKTILILFAACLMLVTNQAISFSQETTEPENKEHKGFFFFKQNKERAELVTKQRQEKKELREKLRKERKDALEKKRQERLEKRKVKRNLIEEEKAKKSELREKEYAKNLAFRKDLKERKDHILDEKRTTRYVEIVSNSEDPLFIIDAKVKNSKTQFLKIRDVDFNYWVKLSNQTPKIINSALLIWERKIPFTQTQTLIKQTIISKPIIPYEKRLVHYNELDSKRNGEIYNVIVGKVIFEDGTQWKNPNWDESEVSIKE